MPKATDDGFGPVREHIDEVEALAESDNPAASFARKILEHMDESVPVRSEHKPTEKPEEITVSSSPSSSETEQIRSVFDF